MSVFDRLATRALPFVPKALLRRFSARYIAGETPAEMLAVVRQLNAEGCLATVDVLGEFVRSETEAWEAAGLYKDVLATIARESLDANISVKLTQMGLLFDPALCERIMADLLETADAVGNFVRIDMEDSTCTSATIDLYLRLRERHANVGIVLQAALRRTLTDVRRIMQAGAGHFRLCKGIYVEPRRVAYRDSDVIHKNYTRILEEMLQGGAYVGIATHHEDLIWEARRLIEHYGLQREQYEFQMLLGVEPELRALLLEEGHRVRVYVPFGRHWHAYCLRRLKENPAIFRHVAKNILADFILT
jgi:proline dehydrogenase